MSTQVFRFVQRKATSIDPGRFQNSAGSFTRLLEKNDHATLLVTNAGGVKSQHMIVNSKSPGDQIGLALAQALNAHMDTDEMPDVVPFTNAVVKVCAKPEMVGRSNQYTSDLLVLAELISEMLPEDTWVALSLRRPQKRESKAYLLWLSHRMGTGSAPVHHSNRIDKVVVSVTVGGRGEYEATSFASYFMGNLPGFDLHTDVRVVAKKSGLRMLLPAAAVVGLGVFVGLPMLPTEVLADLPTLVEDSKVWGGLFTAAAAGAGIFGMTSKAPTPYDSFIKKLSEGFPAPALRGGAARKPTDARTKSVAIKNADGQTSGYDTIHIKETPGDYPLHHECFMMDPSLFAVMVSPHATATTGESVEKERQLPPALTEPRGPRVGVHATGAPVYFDAASIQHGVSIFGTPGAGKSVLTRSLFAWNCLEKRTPSGRTGAPGRNNTLVAFESKGRGGADMYARWGEATGVPVTMIDLMNPASQSINFFDQSRGPIVASQSFVSAMTYAWGEDGIGARSGPVLTQILVAAQAVDNEVVEHHNQGVDAAELPYGKSPVYYAWRMLGGRNMTDAKELYNAIKQKHEEAGGTNRYYSAAVEHAGHIFNMTDSQRRSLTESSKNKLDMLAGLEVWWDPNRKSSTWSEMLKTHGTFVLNMGPSDQAEGFITDRDIGYISAMLMSTLREAITQTCDDWAAKNRWVSVFADELSMIAGSSGEVVEWIRSKGRSFGVRPVFATQYPEQLATQVRDSLMDYSTFVSFRQGNRTAAAAVAYQITTTSSEWSDEDLTLMPDYHMVVRTQVAGRRQDATMLVNDFFEENMHDFAAHQGYQPVTENVTAPTYEPLRAAPVDQLEERNVQL